MALLDRAELLSALTRLGELAVADGTGLDLIVGGGVMVLEFGTRLSSAILTPCPWPVPIPRPSAASPTPWPPNAAGRRTG